MIVRQAPTPSCLPLTIFISTCRNQYGSNTRSSPGVRRPRGRGEMAGPVLGGSSPVGNRDSPHGSERGYLAGPNDDGDAISPAKARLTFSVRGAPARTPVPASLAIERRGVSPSTQAARPGVVPPRRLGERSDRGRSPDRPDKVHPCTPRPPRRPTPVRGARTCVCRCVELNIVSQRSCRDRNVSVSHRFVSMNGRNWESV